MLGELGHLVSDGVKNSRGPDPGPKGAPTGCDRDQDRPGGGRIARAGLAPNTVLPGIQNRRPALHRGLPACSSDILLLVIDKVDRRVAVASRERGGKPDEPAQRVWRVIGRQAAVTGIIGLDAIKQDGGQYQERGPDLRSPAVE